MKKAQIVNSVIHKGVLPQPPVSKTVLFLEGLPSNIAKLLRRTSTNLQVGTTTLGPYHDLRIFGKKSHSLIEVIFEELFSRRESMFFTMRFQAKKPTYTPLAKGVKTPLRPYEKRPGMDLSGDPSMGQRVAGDYAVVMAEADGYVQVGFDFTSPMAKNSTHKKREGITLTLFHKKQPLYPYLQITWDKSIAP